MNFAMTCSSATGYVGNTLDYRKPAHAQLQETHPEMLQEWVTHIIERPYEQWEEYVPDRDEVRTVLVGRVP